MSAWVLPPLLRRPATIGVLVAGVLCLAYPSRPDLSLSFRAFLAGTLCAVLLGWAVQELFVSSFGWLLPGWRHRLAAETLALGLGISCVIAILAVLAAALPLTLQGLLDALAAALLAMGAALFACARLRWTSVLLLATALVLILPSLAGRGRIGGPPVLWALLGLAALAGAAWRLRSPALARRLAEGRARPAVRRRGAGAESSPPLDGSVRAWVRAFWHESFGASRLGWGRTALIVVFVVVQITLLGFLPRQLETAGVAESFGRFLAAIEMGLLEPGGLTLPWLLTMAALLAELARTRVPGTGRLLPLSRRRLALVHGGLSLAHLLATGLLIGATLVALTALCRTLAGSASETTLEARLLVPLLAVLAVMPLAQLNSLALRLRQERSPAGPFHPAVQTALGIAFVAATSWWSRAWTVGLADQSLATQLAASLLLGALSQALWWSFLRRWLARVDLI